MSKFCGGSGELEEFLGRDRFGNADTQSFDCPGCPDCHDPEITYEMTPDGPKLVQLKTDYRNLAA